MVAVHLESHEYGKSRVRLMRVMRDSDSHRVLELTVAVRLEGDFAAAYTDAENRQVVATDTMKNTIYALGKDHTIDTIESFALALARHFPATYAQVTGARIEIEETPWNAIPVGGRPHPHGFSRVDGEQATVSVTVTGDHEEIVSGLQGLVVLKTTDSAFEDFFRDSLTTLPEASERLFATKISAHWRIARVAAKYEEVRTRARTALIETFATHRSRSVQHTLHDMAVGLLEVCPEVDRVDLDLPNLHVLPVDLTPFGRTNDLEVFVPTDEPHGTIRATIARG